MNIQYDMAIVGSGPAGYSAAIYAKRAGMSVILISGMEIGGQLMQTTGVENYPGFVSILGPDLMENMKRQVVELGVEIINDYIKSSDFSSIPYKLNGDKQIYTAKTVVIATGSSAKWLGIKGESEFKGFGVSACATCDGFFFQDQIVAVVGGGNTALEEALFLADIAKKVYLIHRSDTFRGEKILQDRVIDNRKIEIIFDTTVEEIHGDDDPKLIRSITIKNKKTQLVGALEIDGLFVAIGHTPNTRFLKNEIDLDSDGYLQVFNNTNNLMRNGIILDGVYGAGDVVDKVYKQAITSAGSGCKVAIDAKQYLSSKNSISRK